MAETLKSTSRSEKDTSLADVIGQNPELLDGSEDGHCQVAGSVSDERFGSVLETAADGIIVIDDKARIITFNRSCETMFGHKAEEVLGKNVKVVMPPDFAREHDTCVSNYVNGGPAKILGVTREAVGMAKDGTEIPIEVAVGEAHTPEGRQFIGIIRDLRPRREADEKAQILQSQLVQMARVSAIDEMGAAIAHELNQPLTAVLLYLKAIQRKSKSKSELDANIMEVLDKAVREAERAGKIIQRLRQFIEKREPKRQVSDLRKLVDESVELMMLGHYSRNVKVECKIPDNLPEVEVDRVQIQQVLVNLIKNGIEAISNSKDKWLQIEVKKKRGNLLVELEDSGPGIDQDVASDLFNAFSTSKNKGVGLGLAISKGIAQSHGGDLMVDPGGEGKGAVFTLILPIPKGQG